MDIIKKLMLTLVLLFDVMLVQSQELNCRIQVNQKQVQGTADRMVFNSMQKAMYEFMNNTKWTGYKYRYDERIESTILLTIDRRISADEFEGRMTISVRRPIYGTSYNSPTFNWLDKDIHFTFLENEPLEFNENSYSSNLSSILAFYAYMIIGMDFDSFSKFGGTPFFEKAMNILNTAQSGNEKGWNAFDGQKNRYWLVENYLNNAYAAIREASYIYHLNGLDKMWDNLEMGRSKIVEAIELLKVVYNQRSDLFILQLFMQVKRDEIVNIFKKGTSLEKQSNKQ
ncbi:MAG: DUF4835 domain-containing protein [Bacteroidetes bacterium]|nr:MAG: DUF4835 domain-containing protein [Bacteroidota bacterium]